MVTENKTMNVCFVGKHESHSTPKPKNINNKIIEYRSWVKFALNSLNIVIEREDDRGVSSVKLIRLNGLHHQQKGMLLNWKFKIPMC